MIARVKREKIRRNFLKEVRGEDDFETPGSGTSLLVLKAWYLLTLSLDFLVQSCQILLLHIIMMGLHDCNATEELKELKKTTNLLQFFCDTCCNFFVI